MAKIKEKMVSFVHGCKYFDSYIVINKAKGEAR
jgi:hypothetical protein